MRTKLYINAIECDLDDDSIIAFTYTQDDLTDPTVVKNTYSQQISLPGTPTNNRVFANMWRADRQQMDAGFNPLQRAPFELRNSLGEILESGYAKLDTVTRKGTAVTYKVTLYGGLGAFLYALSYDSSGNKRTLADIDYLHTSTPESELNFNITADFVQAAWDRLKAKDADTAPEQIADIINFAPAYEGTPDNFDANKGLIDPTACGLKSSYTDDDGVVYDTKKSDGLTLVELAEDVNAFEAKDLRSYLQRPVFSVPAFLRALQYSDNCGGYSFDCSQLLTKSAFGPYSHLWMTLPRICTLQAAGKTTGTTALDVIDTWESLGSASIDITPQDTIPAGAGAEINFAFNFAIKVPTASATEDALRLYSKSTGRQACSIEFSGFAVQFGVYDADGVAIAASPTYYVCCGETLSDTQCANAANNYINEGGVLTYDSFSKWKSLNSGREQLSRAFVKGGVLGSDTLYGLSLPINVSIDCYGATKIVAYVTPYYYSRQRTTSAGTGGSGGDVITEFRGLDATGTGRYMWLYDGGARLEYSAFGTDAASYEGAVTYTGSDTLRSGALVTKAMLLSTDFTPAEMLLSIVKMFGLALLYDKDTQAVQVVTRNSLYSDTVVNINERIDRSQAMELTPLTFSAKWLTFGADVEGEFADKYSDNYGVDYGCARVDTGYSFSADEKDVTSSIVFNGGVSSVEYGRFYNYVTQDGQYRPSPFLVSGNKQVLWSSAGDTVELDISVPPSPKISYYGGPDGMGNGYSNPYCNLLQCHDADGKAAGGDYVLTFYRGQQGVYAHLSDDTTLMYNLNEGKPCWTLGSGSLSIPRFERFAGVTYGSYIFLHSLDFGRVRELNSPIARYYPGWEYTTVYERFWKALISDRYDQNTRVLTCYVDLRGWQVGQNLLRQFYVFDNALWVLNKISDYSPNSLAPVKCEFIRVQDKANYLNGQKFD